MTHKRTRCRRETCTENAVSDAQQKRNKSKTCRNRTTDFGTDFLGKGICVKFFFFFFGVIFSSFSFFEFDTLV